MDVIYIHIPSHGWWYVVTVIDYYSRYLLACHLTFSCSDLQVIYTLQLAREEAELIGRPLVYHYRVFTTQQTQDCSSSCSFTGNSQRFTIDFNSSGVFSLGCQSTTT